ncbi:MAG: transaldolase family protein [Thermodesulfobacteriota bacterium]
MAEKHILEKIAEINPEAEIWWDSSPLIYRNWAREMVEKAPDGKREIWSKQLKRLFDPENSGATFFRGVTTNPPLSFNAIKDDPPFWAKFVKELIRANPEKGVEEIFWLTYKEVVKRGADFFLPVWEKSNHKHGYLSGQVDPRYLFDTEKMFAQAMDLSQLSPNVMIKCPGSREGYELIRRLTALGIATNNTLAFTVPQFIACMEAVQEGLRIARENHVDLFRWRSVITHMSARYGTLGDLKSQAESRGIDLSEADVRWAELSIFKRGYGILQEKGYPNKMLICSMRISPPTDDGTAASWHVEKVAGGDIVYTVPPKYIAQLMEVEDRMRPFDSEAIHEPPPPKTLDKLLKIPYFAKSYQPDGMVPDEFNQHAALIATAAEFSTATRGMVDFVARQFQAEGRM